MSVGRLELPTNGLKGHCSTIELHAHNQVIIVAREALSVNIGAGLFYDLSFVTHAFQVGTEEIIAPGQLFIGEGFFVASDPTFEEVIAFF